MSNEANTNEATPATEAPKAVTKPSILADGQKGMQRKYFDNANDAVKYLAECADNFSDFDSDTVIWNGFIADEDGNPVADPEVYTDSMRCMVDVVTKRGKATTNAKGERVKPVSTLLCIVVTAVPTLASVFETDLGKDWIKKIAANQLAVAATLRLRKDGADLEAEAENLPSTIEDYFVSQRTTDEASATFNDLADLILAAFKKSEAVKRARLNKSSLRQCFASADFALHTCATLEDRGDKKSRFVEMLEYGITLAEATNRDASIFRSWLATRNNSTMEEIEDEDLDLDALAAEAIAKLTATPAANEGQQEEDAGEGTDNA